MLNDVLKAITDALIHPGICVRDVGNLIATQFPDMNYVDRDIYNVRALICRQRLDGYTGTVAVIKEFNKLKIPYIAKWADPDTKEDLIGIVFSYPLLLLMTALLWEVIQVDKTYSINIFSYLLF